MDRLLMYHNPRCSKSRGAQEILNERGADVEVVEYLQQHPSREDLERIVSLIPDPPAELVRKDDTFKSLGLDAADYQTSEQVVDILLKHPELMQRPVIIKGDRAVIARPSEKVLELLD